MKVMYKIFLTIIFICACTTYSFSQIFGPEQIQSGNFGTVADGINDGGGASANIYPTVNGIGTNIPYYYQPAKQVFHNGNLVYIDVNPGVTIGKPIPDKTSYIWGINEIWDTTPYYFPRTNGTNSNQVVPHAPNNGYYIIATSTKGMYDLPSLSNKNWYTIYDKYETDTSNSNNYFLITNADYNQNKIFYKEHVNIIPGQAYRMSVDLAKLNTVGDNPNVSFIINPNESLLPTATSSYTTGLITQGGQWINHYFDYIAPCGGGTSTYVAFRNQSPGGNGNDLALDNLSMKAIIPQIKANIADCDEASFVMLDNAIENAFPSDRYILQWQKKNGSNYTDITGATSEEYPISEDGTYRLTVYTSTTAACRMNSNEIVIAHNSGTSCWEIPTPIAVNDTLDIIFETSNHRNILNNDNAESPGVHGDLSVISYKIRSQTYAAGTSAVVYADDGTTQLGVVTIQENGDLNYEAIYRVFGKLPPIEYTVSQKGGGSDTALILITYISYTGTIDASCTSCPISVEIQSQFVDASNSYTIYKDDELIATGVVSDTTLTFKFYEESSGTIYYSFRIGSNRILDFPVQVAPSKATWAPNLILNSDSWDIPYNWMSDSGTGFPIWCTDVVIPGDAPFYPTITQDGYDWDECRDIIFKDSATVGQIHRLHYRCAFVELSPKRLNWMMLTPPLKYIYSADYQADPTWGDKAGVNPPIYMRYFDMQYSADTLTSKPNPDGTKGVSVGNFSKSFANLKERLNLTKGFVLRIDEGKNNTFDGTYKFPRLNADSTEVLFKYHYRSTGNWINEKTPGVTDDQLPFKFTDAGQPGRGSEEMPTDEEWVNIHENNDSYQPRGKDNRYRFIFERSDNPNEVPSFTITVDNGGTTDIIGNPFMSHLDFDKFAKINEDNIQPYYRIWDGTSFYSYVDGGVDGGVWSGLPPVQTEVLAQGSRYIAPMQAFFVEMKAGKNQLIFTPDSISVAASDSISSNGLRSAKSNNINNLIKLRLKMEDYENVAVVASLPLASDSYKPEEDVYKLFSYNVDRPEIYTIADNQAIDINAVSTSGNEKIIPVGIRTTKTGKFNISAENINNFNVFPYVYLTDTENNKTYNLRDVASFSFDKKGIENFEGRLYLLFRNDELPMGIEQNHSGNSIGIYKQDGSVRISSPLSELSDIKVFDISGRIILSKKQINSLSYSIDTSLYSGIYIIKAKSVSSEQVFKVKI